MAAIKTETEPPVTATERRVQVLAWVLTVLGLAVFAIGFPLDRAYANNAHLGLLVSLGLMLLAARIVVVVKWRR